MPSQAFLRIIGASVLLAVTSGCNPISTVRARRVAREGNSLYRAADYRGAIAKYHEALALDEDTTPNVYLNLGYALFSIYNPDSTIQADRDAAAEAVSAFDHYIAEVPEDEKAKSFRIKTLLRAAPRDPAMADKAFTLFTDLLRAHPEDKELRGYLISLFIDCQRYEQAVQYFGEQLKKKPDDIETMKVLAIIADKSGKVDEAVNWYRQRVKTVTDPAAKASMLYELGTYAWNVLHYQPEKAGGVSAIRLADQGIEACRQAMALKQDYAEAMAYANLLYLKRANNEPNDQAKYYDQMLAYNLRTQAGKILTARKAAQGGANADQAGSEAHEEAPPTAAASGPKAKTGKGSAARP